VELRYGGVATDGGDWIRTYCAAIQSRRQRSCQPAYLCVDDVLMSDVLSYGTGTLITRSGPDLVITVHE